MAMDIHQLELSINCAAQVAYHEGSTKNERIAILNVLHNRVKSGRWGSDVCSVAYADGQFIGVTDESHAQVDKKTLLETKLLALDVLVFHKYANPVADALYFHDESIQAKNTWFGKKRTVKIGKMIFY